MAVTKRSEGSGQEPDRTVDGALPRWGPWVLKVAVALQVLIVLTGGIVRLTGSGLGCPTWPNCVPGSLVPVQDQSEGFHKIVEFGNRTLTGPVLLFAVLALIAVLRSGRRDLRWPGAIPVILTLAQAVIGGITVRTQLYPATVAVHMLVSIALVATSTWLYLRTLEGDEPATRIVPTPVQRLGWALGAVTAMVIILGTIVTGAGPHAGDVDEAVRWNLDVRYASWLHADAVLLFVGMTIGMGVVLAVIKAPQGPRRWWWWLILVTVVQGALGYLQFGLGVPAVLVAIHMVGACVLTILVTGMVWSLRARGQRPVKPICVDPGPPAQLP